MDPDEKETQPEGYVTNKTLMAAMHSLGLDE